MKLNSLIEKPGEREGGNGGEMGMVERCERWRDGREEEKGGERRGERMEW